MNTLILVSRKSPLAMWQAQHVQQQLQQKNETLAVSILGITTEGDQKLTTALNKIGGKGLFIKALEDALYAKHADAAVHSMKDVTATLPSGLAIAAILPRAEPRDAFVSNHFNTLLELPQGATVGTSSLRRQAQLWAIRPDLNIKLLRGNVNTRLRRLDEGEFDAILLAAAGLQRLGFSDRIQALLPVKDFIPAVGQGALGIECREDASSIWDSIASLNDPLTATCVAAERAMNLQLGGSCHVPVAGYAELTQQGELWLRGMVGDPQEKQILTAQARAPIEQAIELGQRVADDLIAQGAAPILQRYASDS